jgi:hypothetical protein
MEEIQYNAKRRRRRRGRRSKRAEQDLDEATAMKQSELERETESGFCATKREEEKHRQKRKE